MKQYLIFIFLLVSTGLWGQTRINELPAKTNADSTWLILTGNPNTGRLYKMNFDNLKDSIIGAVSSVGGGTDTTSLSNRIDLKLNSVDTASLSNRIDGKIGGTIAAPQVAFGTAANTVGGSANLTWTGSQLSLVTNSDLASSAITGVAITNNNASGYANSIWYNSGGDIGQFMLTGSSGAIAGTTIRARQAVFISVGGTGGLNFYTSAGPIYFTPGGGTTESVTFKANGIVNLSAASRQVFADDTAAGVGGLVTGDIYQTSAGVLMVKQ